jgi:hypothetical protein
LYRYTPGGGPFLVRTGEGFAYVGWGGRGGPSWGPPP